MKIINDSDEDIEVLIGVEKAVEPDYWFNLEAKGKSMDGNRKNLDEDNINLQFEDLIVFRIRKTKK